MAGVDFLTHQLSELGTARTDVKGSIPISRGGSVSTENMKNDKNAPETAGALFGQLSACADSAIDNMLIEPRTDNTKALSPSDWQALGTAVAVTTHPEHIATVDHPKAGDLVNRLAELNAQLASPETASDALEDKNNHALFARTGFSLTSEVIQMRISGDEAGFLKAAGVKANETIGASLSAFVGPIKEIADKPVIQMSQ